MHTKFEKFPRAPVALGDVFTDEHLMSKWMDQMASTLANQAAH